MADSSKENAQFVPVVTDEQISQTAALAEVIWHECFARILKPEQIEYMVEKFQSAPAMTEQIRSQGYEYYLICAEEQPVGYVGVQAKDGKLLLSKLYLDKAARGRGFGQQALSFVEGVAKSRGCEGVWLTVNRHNERAISVYRKTGYALAREEVQDIGGGFVMDDFIFEKPL